MFSRCFFLGCKRKIRYFSGTDGKRRRSILAISCRVRCARVRFARAISDRAASSRPVIRDCTPATLTAFTASAKRPAQVLRTSLACRKLTAGRSIYASQKVNARNGRPDCAPAPTAIRTGTTSLFTTAPIQPPVRFWFAFAAKDRFLSSSPAVLKLSLSSVRPSTTPCSRQRPPLKVSNLWCASSR